MNSPKPDALNESASPIADEDNSDNETLEIILKSPNNRKRKPLEPTDEVKNVIGSIEDELEENLGEKAAKMNMNVVHVKNLLRQVVTNEDVLAMVRKAENPAEVELVPSYEPKLTRSKAKELSNLTPVPWVTPKPPAVVRVLVDADLPEDDSSGDEYLPGDQLESLDGEEIVGSDHDSSIFSDPPSVEPPTPPFLSLDPESPKTEWTEDGVFKIPWRKESEDEATIALRTRSKLCLTSTPLEVIEEAFVPPDAPPLELRDTQGDNEDWMDFLKQFTLPLDEVVKANEDEEQDPEYNVLADEEIDEVDKEELRVDKAVKVSKRELVDLIAELFDEVDFEDQDLERSQLETPQVSGVSGKTNAEGLFQPVLLDKVEENLPVMIESGQIPLLHQQMTQHVQMLTQNFLLTYNHPELHQSSLMSKEYLMNIKFLCEQKEKSIFHTVNLTASLEIVDYWERKMAADSDDVKKMKMQIEESITKSIRSHQIGTPYVLELPDLVLETMLNSTAFVYTSLLPKIPFKSPKIAVKQCVYYSESEDHLISLGLEQFLPLVAEGKPSSNKMWSRKKGYPACKLIQEHMLAYREAGKIFNHVNFARHNRCANNPIKYFFQHGKAPPSVHYVVPVGPSLPPGRRPPSELPYQWNQYLSRQQNKSTKRVSLIPINIETSPLRDSFSGNHSFILPKTGAVRKSAGRNLLNNKRRYTKRNSDADPITKFVRILSRPSHARKLIQLFACSSPDNSPIKMNECEESAVIIKENKVTSDSCSNDFAKIFPNMPMLNASLDSDFISQESESKCNKISVTKDVALCSKQDGVKNEFGVLERSTVENKLTEGASNTEKDDMNDLNALMIASSSIKNTIKKEPSGAEKKRTKVKKEFLANIALTTPDDPATEKQKSEKFALAFYDKMREKLDLDDYHKIVQTLSNHEKGDAVDIYKKVDPILRPKYTELADEFLLFLRAKEASAVDRLIPWIRMNNRTKFLKKIEVYFKGQPSQLKKVYTCLTELSQMQDRTSEKIKNSLLPMFKGNSLLSDLFLQNFLDEPPPPSLLAGPYETIDIAKEMSKNANEEEFETVVVPDVDDKYGGSTCICTCHQIEDSEFQSRYRHCTKCGTKFVNGRVFIQSGRGLRPAIVTFPKNPNADHNSRLVGTPSTANSKKNRPHTPKQTATATKEHLDEETDDDVEGKKKAKKRPAKRPKKEAEKSPRRAAAQPRGRGGRSPAKKKKKEARVPAAEVEVAGKCGGVKIVTVKRLGGEQSGVSLGEVKSASPERQTAESESEFCEESSQDNCESDSNSSVFSFTNQERSLETTSNWRREEDKVILEVFQKENDKDHAFKIIAGQLTNRSIDEIKSRFNTLMKLLMETIKHT